MNLENGDVSLSGLLVVLFPVFMLIAYFAGLASKKTITIKVDPMSRWKLTKKRIRVCSKHVGMLKTKQLAILDNKNCEFCTGKDVA